MTETKSSKKYVLIMHRNTLSIYNGALVFDGHYGAVIYTGVIENALGGSPCLVNEKKDHSRDTYEIVLPGPEQDILTMTIISIDSDDVRYHLDIYNSREKHTETREFTKCENAIRDAERIFEEHGYAMNEVESSLRALGSISEGELMCSLQVVILDKQEKYKDRIMEALGTKPGPLVRTTKSQISIPYWDPAAHRLKIIEDVLKDDKPSSNRSIAPLIILFLVAIIMMVVLGKMIGFWGVLGVSIALYIIIYVIVKSQE